MNFIIFFSRNRKKNLCTVIFTSFYCLLIMWRCFDDNKFFSRWKSVSVLAILNRIAVLRNRQILSSKPPLAKIDKISRNWIVRLIFNSFEKKFLSQFFNLNLKILPVHSDSEWQEQSSACVDGTSSTGSRWRLQLIVCCCSSAEEPWVLKRNVRIENSIFTPNTVCITFSLLKITVIHILPLDETLIIRETRILKLWFRLLEISPKNWHLSLTYQSTIDHY